MDVQVRWLIRRDMTDVLRIERTTSIQTWTDEDFLTCLRQRNCIGMVAEYDQKIVGFMVYEHHKSRLHVLKFAVDQNFQRQRVGEQMVDRLVDKLSKQRRNEILFEVNERDLDRQLFFSKLGFKAIGTLEDTIREITYYIMRYRLSSQSSSSKAEYTLRNRIANYNAAEFQRPL